jgi:hypothetical protein
VKEAYDSGKEIPAMSCHLYVAESFYSRLMASWQVIWQAVYLIGQMTGTALLLAGLPQAQLGSI